MTTDQVAAAFAGTWRMQIDGISLLQEAHRGTFTVSRAANGAPQVRGDWGGESIDKISISGNHITVTAPHDLSPDSIFDATLLTFSHMEGTATGCASNGCKWTADKQ